MTSIAEFTLSATDFPLGEVFEERPAATVELDRVVPSGDTVMPYFWVEDPGRRMDVIQSAFDDLPALRSVVLMEDLGDRGLFRAEWEPEYMGIMRAIPEADVTVVSAVGSGEGWVFELRAEAVEQFSRFQRYCDEHDIDVTLARLRRLSEVNPGVEYDLTPEQREALVLAYTEGTTTSPARPTWRPSRHGSGYRGRPCRPGSDGATATSSRGPSSTIDTLTGDPFKGVS